MIRRTLFSRGKWFILGGLFLVYVIVTYSMSGMPPNCPTVQETLNSLSQKQLRAALRSRSNESFAMRAVDLGIPLAAVVGADFGAKSKRIEGPLGELKEAKTVKVGLQNDDEIVEKLPHSVLLDPHLAPNTVYYVWCGKRWFEFNHYVALLSVIRKIRPDNIVFYYDFYPVLDVWLYNTWIDEIAKEYPFFRSRKLEPNERACSADSKVDMFFVYGLLSTRGGMYVDEHTVFPSFPIISRKLDLLYGTLEDNRYGFMMSQRGLPGKFTVNELMNNTRWKTANHKCPTWSISTATDKMPFCFSLPNRMFPKDIWALDSAFGRLVRTLFYKNPSIPKPRKSYDNLVPNIAHIVWIGGGEMDFLFYLCVLSLVYVAKVDMVYIHGDAPPAGHYWTLVKDNSKVTLVYRETPKTIYGTRVNIISHVTDVWRVDFMVKYGGIYVDTDTAFVRPLDREIRSYDAVATYDWTYWNHPFPDTINFGVSIGKKNATFWHKFQESMRWFRDEDWAWNGLRQPYRITERHPELALIDPHMQVTCYKFKCHPTWWPDYHNESVHHLNSASITDWRKDVYAFHWTLPTPPELQTEDNLRKSSTMFSEIAKFILELSGHKL